MSKSSAKGRFEIVLSVTQSLILTSSFTIMATLFAFAPSSWAGPDKKVDGSKKVLLESRSDRAILNRLSEMKVIDENAVANGAEKMKVIDIVGTRGPIDTILNLRRYTQPDAQVGLEALNPLDLEAAGLALSLNRGWEKHEGDSTKGDAARVEIADFQGHVSEGLKSLSLAPETYVKTVRWLAIVAAHTPKVQDPSAAIQTRVLNLYAQASGTSSTAERIRLSILTAIDAHPRSDLMAKLIESIGESSSISRMFLNDLVSSKPNFAEVSLRIGARLLARPSAESRGGLNSTEIAKQAELQIRDALPGGKSGLDLIGSETARNLTFQAALIRWGLTTRTVGSTPDFIVKLMATPSVVDRHPDILRLTLIVLDRNLMNALEFEGIVRSVLLKALRATEPSTALSTEPVPLESVRLQMARLNAALLNTALDLYLRSHTAIEPALQRALIAAVENGRKDVAEAIDRALLANPSRAEADPFIVQLRRATRRASAASGGACEDVFLTAIQQ